MQTTTTQPTHRKLLLALALAALCGSAGAAPLGDHPRAAGRVDERIAHMAETLDLTDAQQAEIRRLIEDHHARGDAERAALRDQIDGVLTPAQRTAWEQQRGERAEERLARLADRLDLTDSQREEVATILREKHDDPGITPAMVRERIAAVLTPEQQARLRELRDRRGGERGDRGGPGPEGRGGPPAGPEPLF